MLSWHCLYLKQVTLTPPPLSQWQTPSEAALTSGCSTIAPPHTRTDTDTRTKSKALPDLICIFRHTQCTCNVHTHTHTHTHTQCDNSYDICIYVKLASPFSAGQDPIIPVRWAERQPVSHSARQQRWQKRIPDPGAFTRPSIHPFPSFICRPPCIPPLLLIQQQPHACMHTSPDFMGPSSGHEEWLPLLHPPPIPPTPNPSPSQARRLSIFNGDEMVLTSTSSPSVHPSFAILIISSLHLPLSVFFHPLCCLDLDSDGVEWHFSPGQSGTTHISQPLPQHIGIFLFPLFSSLSLSLSLSFSLSLYCP